MNDDLISRQAVLSVLVFADETKDMTCKDMRNVLDAINAIPSAEPERTKGEWIEEDLSGYLTPGGNSIYHCSECGHTEGPWPHPRLTNFCPSCGADMRGENGQA